MTSDPYEASEGAGKPTSWNRFAYSATDPVNLNDPLGVNLNDPLGLFYAQVGGRGDGGDGTGGGHGNPVSGPSAPEASGGEADPGGGGSGAAPLSNTPECLKDVKLNEAQQSLLGSQQCQDFSPGQQIAFLNFTAAAADAGVILNGLTVERFGVGSSGQTDRMFLTGITDDITSALSTNSQFTDKYTGKPHPPMLNNFRQEVAMYGLQIGTGDDIVEIDIDIFVPTFGVGPLIAHALEVFFNDVVRRQSNNPASVAQGLRKRGIDPGHQCGK